MKTIYVLTNPEDGWDCISGAYESLESFLKNFSERFLDEDEKSELFSLPFSEVKNWEDAEEFVDQMGFILHEIILHD